MIRSFFFSILLAFTATTIQAQERIKFEKMSVADGMSQSSVLSTVQDSQGFIWFATLDGLNKYDGYSFEVYWNSPNTPGALTDNVINFLYETPDADKPTLWIGTAGKGLCRYNRISDDFTAYMHDSEKKNSLSDNSISSITGSNEALWIGTNKGVNKFNSETEKFETFYPQKAGCSDTITALALSGNKLWVGTDDGLCVLDTKNNQFTNLCSAPDFKNCNINALHYAQDGSLWIGSSTGLFRLDKDGTIKNHTKKIEALLPGSHKEITALSEDPDSGIWIGTRSEGLIHFNLSKEKMSLYKHDPADRMSISANSILSIYRDRTDILWVGTSLGGVNKWNRAAEDLLVFRHNPYDEYSLSAPQVRTFHSDKNSNIWIGTVEGGLNKWDKSSNQFIHYRHRPGKRNGLPHNHVRAIWEDEKGNFWIGTGGGGLSYFKPETKVFTNYKAQKADKNGLPGEHIWDIQQYSDSILMLAVYDGGFSLFNRYEKTFRTYKHKPGDKTSISGNRVTTILNTGDEVWIGTFSGLNLWYPAEEKFLRFQYNPEDENSLSNNRIYSLHEDSDGNLWVGTKGGLNKYRPETGDFMRMTTDNSDLPNNVFLGILEEGEHLWVSTNNGISRIHKKELKVKNFDMGDGLQSNEFLANSAHKSPEGELFFGGIDGFNAFFPSKIKDNPHQPSVIITNIEVNNETLPTDTVHSMKRVIELDHNQNDVSFEFVALDFIFPKKNRYAYQLEGYDSELNYVRFRRYAKYTNLPPGKYTFRVIGSNNDEVWNKKGTTIELIIHPAFWQTLWFKISVIALVVLIIISIYRIRVRNIKRRNEYLEAEVKKRTFEIRQQNEEIKTQRDEIEIQKNHIEKQKQEITDSIIYAKRIQTAAMPSEEYLDENLPPHFVLFKPRDIVSGDFYWAGKNKDKIIITAADCTGHGVPGAFMSMLGISFLNKIVNEKNITEPNEILNRLRHNVIEALHQNYEDADGSKDGMDIAMTVIDLSEKKIKFAGAFNPMYVIKEGEAKELGADRMPVGVYDYLEPFNLRETDFGDADMIYMFSDGYPDQFGGPKGKKFMKGRFRKLLVSVSDKDMQTQHDILDKTIEEWRGYEAQVDDIVVVGISLKDM